MKFKSSILLLLIIILNISCHQQKLNMIPEMKIVQQADGVSRSLRGLSVVNDQIAWLSGTNGTVGITIDGGKNWHENIVEGAENLDFRDIEAINDKVAWIVSAGVPGRIYKTIDGGNKWNLQYEKTENVFFDSFVFSDINNGMAVGDPEAGEFFLLRTSNSGKTWEEIDGEKLPDAINGEALFAASGTCITTYGNDNIWFITGGTSAARAFCSYDSGESWIAAKTPISYGSSSKGIFSVAFYNKLTGIIVGGDYAIDSLSNENTALTYDGGKTWDLVEKQRPDGFKSCVSYVPETGGKGLIATGTSGVDYSIDGGLTWKNISKDSYNVVAFGNTFDSGWLCGSGGKIAKIIFEIKK